MGTDDFFSYLDHRHTTRGLASQLAEILNERRTWVGTPLHPAAVRAAQTR